MASTLDLLLKEVKPYIIRTDRGGEYKGNAHKFLVDHGIRHLTTSEHSKANYAERLMRMLRLKIARYMRHHHSHAWYKALPFLT